MNKSFKTVIISMLCITSISILPSGNQFKLSCNESQIILSYVNILANIACINIAYIYKNKAYTDWNKAMTIALNKTGRPASEEDIKAMQRILRHQIIENDAIEYRTHENNAFINYAINIATRTMGLYFTWQAIKHLIKALPKKEEYCQLI